MAPPARNNDRANNCEELPPDLTESSGSGSEMSEGSEESPGNADDWDGIDASDNSDSETGESEGTATDEDEEKLERDIEQGNHFFKNRQWSKAEVAYEDAIDIIKSRDLEEGEVMVLKILPSLLMCYLSLKKFESAVGLVATVVDNTDTSNQLSDSTHLYSAIAMSLFGFVDHCPALMVVKTRERIELTAVYFAIKAMAFLDHDYNETDENNLVRGEDPMIDLIAHKMCKKSELYEELSPIALIDFKTIADDIRKLKFEETSDEAIDELMQPASKLKKMDSARMLKRALIAFKAQKYDIATRYFKMADGEFTAKRDKDAAILTKYAIAKTFWSRDTDTKNPEEIINMMKEITNLKEGRSFAPALLEQSKLYYENKMLAEAESLLHTSTLIVRSKGYVATNHTTELCSVFPELDPAELEKRLDEHRDVLHRHPEPLAICRFERCFHLPPHNTNPQRREIFPDDPGFKCFYELVCTEKCSVTLHQACWKGYKDDRGSANASERELLTSQCLTPDCKGPIAKIMKKERDKENPVKIWEADSDAIFAAIQRMSGTRVPPTNSVKDSSVKPQQAQIEKPTSKRALEPTPNEQKKQLSGHKITGARLDLEPDVRVGGSVLQPKSASITLEQTKDAVSATANSLGARSKVTKKSDKISTSSQDGLQLLVENLPPNCNEEDLCNLFCGFGRIGAIQINENIGMPGPAKGFIIFEEVDAVQEVFAYQQHSPICLSGNQLKVEAKNTFKIKPLMDVKISQETKDRIESTYDAKIDKMRHHRKNMLSEMDEKLSILGGSLSQKSKKKVHLVDGKVVSAKIDVDTILGEIQEQSQSMLFSYSIEDGVRTTTTSPTFREKELAREMEVLKIELENQQNFAHYLLGTLQEMRLKYNETAKNEIDVMGELLVISDLLVKEMRKTENNQLSAQEVYNLELTKLQSEKAAKIKANLGQRNRFQDFLRERVDENLLSAAPPQDNWSQDEDGTENNFNMDEMIENMSQIYTDLSKEDIYNLLMTNFRGRRASGLSKGSASGKYEGVTEGVGLEDPAVTDFRITSSVAKELSSLGTVDVMAEEDEVMSSECTICLEGLEATHRYKLKCDHSSFHFECIRTWLMDTKSCPICRTPHFDDDEYPSLN